LAPANAHTPPFSPHPPAPFPKGFPFFFSNPPHTQTSLLCNAPLLKFEVPLALGLSVRVQAVLLDGSSTPPSEARLVLPTRADGYLGSGAGAGPVRVEACVGRAGVEAVAFTLADGKRTVYAPWGASGGGRQRGARRPMGGPLGGQSGPRGPRAHP